MPMKHVNGVNLFYDEIGQGAAIIFHHGYTGAHDVWLDEIAPRLQHKYRCIVMDCRGAGDSEQPDGGYNISQYARDVIGLADELGLQKFTYVGHSMGGGIGYQLGVEHAHRLDKLVLVAPIPAGGTRATDAMLQAAIAQRKTVNARTEMINQRLKLRLRATEASVELSVDRALSVSDGHFKDSWYSMRDFNVVDKLPNLQTQTLIVAGAADGLCEANVNDWQNLPNATLHVFSRVGHGVPRDVPDEFSKVLDDFMEHGVINAKTQQAKLQQ
ncbi:MAG: alpha/beta hydrolase [Gammaproteobacteria bacterium]|nr:alpha/beta hydrolase [Gammaproteobacteria bacterium]MBT5153921.1 alpha/beta hydrolase [Gammaproteobacteria bacterium]MBT5686659.1 alpha/beta hydrolase [Gammaproteobacteria bacterium]MBT5726011.1 alpha/beta hydrolase [Gammaproteobacteria bacterium]MBT6584898.1 alpha/beta hydrolase [Gammaproteobacteria bacterium]